MKATLQLVLLAVVCLGWPLNFICAQEAPGAKSSAGTGSLAGTVKDPTGAVVGGAAIQARNASSQAEWSLTSSREGRFVFDELPAGEYQITVIVPGFEMAILRGVVVAAGRETTVEISLRIGPVKTEIEVNALDTSGVSVRKVAENERAGARSAASLLDGTPGVSVREDGQFASAPFLNGLGDERAKLVVDGMTVSSACANHMNPPLSYVSPAQVAQVTVMAGITPVSVGGDSLGGTVIVDSPDPVFAAPGERLHRESNSSGFYRSNGENYGGSLSGWIGGRNLAMGYNGWWATGGDYTDGSGHKVTSTYAQTTDHTVTLAAQGAGNLFVLQAGLHHTPYEGFVNAQMDLVRNFAESLNLHYRRSLGPGALDARVFWQNTWHDMNIGHDKQTFPMPMWMPMHTHGRDLGYSIQWELPLGARHTLRVGNEMHRFVLDDIWPAVAGTAPSMGPNTFVSIDHGRRLRVGTFVEAASKWNPQWSTLVGVRNDTVWTNAGAVQGYSDLYAADASAFNAANRAHTDPDFDLTAMARYQRGPASAFEFGYARKSRAPNLYERYAWSTDMMASGMIGWFGDGNYYVGNLALQPETSNTVSGTASWHEATHGEWELKATPYLTLIRNFVDVDTLMTTTYGMSTFAQLQFANHSARIAGADLSGSGALWKSDSLGVGRLSGVGGWLHGERTDSNTPLYQMMPVHERVALDEEMKSLTAGVGVEAVDRKRHLDPRRYEQAMPGYALFNIHASYRRGAFAAGAQADNLFNRAYELPLGGVNFDDFMAGMWMGQIKPLTGRGRTASFSLTARF